MSLNVTTAVMSTAVNTAYTAPDLLVVSSLRQDPSNAPPIPTTGDKTSWYHASSRDASQRIWSVLHCLPHSSCPPGNGCYGLGSKNHYRRNRRYPAHTAFQNRQQYTNLWVLPPRRLVVLAHYARHDSRSYVAFVTEGAMRLRSHCCWRLHHRRLHRSYYQVARDRSAWRRSQ
ncbi:hypothetical protein B0H12DRAFT_125771 [Mycena haematopus]|nr:hypothetical protein B0H12DRAFT_125771 [Mycena haematopus]